MKTIAIIGRGTSSIVSAMTCLTYGYNVEIYFDPNSPHLSVGESTTPHLAQLILKTFNITIGELLDNNIVSFKNGIKFINWGVGKEFRHHFQTNLSAFHFESGIFNPFFHDLLKRHGVIYHEKEVNECKIINDKIFIEERMYDFVISCVGWSDNENYYEPLFETVNCGILYKENCINDPSYTLHIATKHGWQFGLPFPNDNVTKCGYLFNSNIDDEKEVIEELSKQESKIIKWKPRYSKRLIQNKFYGFNGNRLFFLEPLQALSVYYYIKFANKICEYLLDPRHETFEIMNDFYLKNMYEYQISLAWHYNYGSIFDSSFWKNVTNKSDIFLNTNPIYSKDSLIRKYIHDSKYTKNDFLSIGPFDFTDFKMIHNGMSVDDIDKLKLNYEQF